LNARLIADIETNTRATIEIQNDCNNKLTINKTTKQTNYDLKERGGNETKRLYPICFR
jgi:hypothetical protein